MATKKETNCSMTIKVSIGTDADGKTIFGKRSLSYINPELTDEDFCAIGAGLSRLQSHELATVTRTMAEVFEV